MAQTKSADRSTAGRKVLTGSGIATMLAAVPIAAVAGLMALTSTVRTRIPDAVPAFWSDPIAAMTSWSSVVAGDPNRVGDPRTRLLATAVLRTQPLNPLALRMLAGWNAAHGNSKQADRLADLSQQVTRRDLGTQLFQIEHLVAEGDVAGALSHYDIALRTTPDSRSLLFPILMSAMADPTIRTAMVPYVARNTPWMPGFLFNALDAQGGAVSVAKLILDQRAGTQSDLASNLAPSLLTHLMGAGEFELAERYVSRLSGGGSSLLTDTSFNSRTTDPRYGPFRWQPTDAPDVDTTFERLTDTRRVLSVSAHTRAIGSQLVLKRVLKLPPGTYRFSERRGATSDGGSTLWRVTCLMPKTPQGVIWTSDSASALLQIPSSCPWQQIDLQVTGAQDSASYNLIIDDVKLQPVGTSIVEPARH